MAVGCESPPSRREEPVFPPSEIPNVVLIVIDTLRTDKHSFYGFDLETCSELDAVARAGVLFEHVIAPSS